LEVDFRIDTWPVVLNTRAMKRLLIGCTAGIPDLWGRAPKVERALPALPHLAFHGKLQKRG